MPQHSSHATFQVHVAILCNIYCNVANSMFWSQLFKGWITLFTVKHSVQWIEIYLLDNVFHPLNKLRYPLDSDLSGG